MTKKGLWTQSLQLYFTSQQLQQLNIYFSDMENFQGDLKHNQTANWVEGKIEKLIQYLCYVVGNLDPRFSSEYIVRLDPAKNCIKSSNCFSYLIRLDSLSIPDQQFNKNTSPDYYLEFEGNRTPEGFARIRFKDEASCKKWNGCVTNNGYLRRDKIQSKFIELLEVAALSKVENVQKIIPKVISYNSPGKIVDAETLHHILSVPPQERIFYGSSEVKKKFDSSNVRKYRIEVIESNHMIRLRIGFLSPNVLLDEDVDVILILGIGCLGWPSICDYPNRISLTNCDILLHHQMASTGFFLMTVCPSRTIVDKNQSTLWQFFFPTMDCMITNHYSELSCFNRCVNILYAVMLNLRRTTPGGYTVGKYILKTLLWFQLEKLNEPKYWTSDYLSYHVIFILDQLVDCLRKQKCRSYFFNNYDVIANSFRNVLAGHIAEDYKEDADIIDTFLQRIYALSSSELIGHQAIMEERRQIDTFAYEVTLMRRWSDLLISMMNNRKPENRVMGFISKQIEYITYLFRSVLYVQSLILAVNSEKNNSIHGCINYSAHIMKHNMNNNRIISVEQISFIVSVIFDQAKRLYLTNVVLAKRSNANRKNSMYDTKLEILYKEAVDTALIRMKENAPNIFSSDFQAVKFVLETIYQSTVNSKILRRVLKPYLKEFSISTHENCWFLEEWKNRIYNDEMEALRVFSRLVSEKKIKFKAGLLDALQKGWDWAQELFRMCARYKSGQNLLFTQPNGRITRRYLILSDEEIDRLSRHQLSYSKYGYRSVVNELLETMQFEKQTENFENDVSVYFHLRDYSPMTLVVNNNRRRGIHLGLGNIIFSFITLGKFTMLQEITQVLPEERRHQALESIQRAIKEKQRVEREKIKSLHKEESYRLLPDEYLPGSALSAGKIRYSVGQEHLLSLLDDSSSSEMTYSSTCSSSFSNSRCRLPFNPASYKDTSITYLTEQNDLPEFHR